MKELVKKYLGKINGTISDGLVKSERSNHPSLADEVAYRTVSETILNSSTKNKQPNDVFCGVSDDFWFWLNTVGARRNSLIRHYLPKLPSDDIQYTYTGEKGDDTLRKGFNYYKLFRDQYQKYKGEISGAENILDYGCGWGRIIRFFLKDLEPQKIWGCDPVPEMIKLCKEQNRWSRFQEISTNPPTPFQDNTFDLIYSFSVFSHLSEEMHLTILNEIKRILKPGGIYMTTTRNRGFIQYCADLRARTDLSKLHAVPAGSSQAFPNTQASIAAFDQGKYCFHSFNDVNWSYWGETAIPKQYVLDNWTKKLNVLDFLELQEQNLIIVQKPI